MLLLRTLQLTFYLFDWTKLFENSTGWTKKSFVLIGQLNATLLHK